LSASPQKTGASKAGFSITAWIPQESWGLLSRHFGEAQDHSGLGARGAAATVDEPLAVGTAIAPGFPQFPERLSVALHSTADFVLVRASGISPSMACCTLVRLQARPTDKANNPKSGRKTCSKGCHRPQMPWSVQGSVLFLSL
jgi:hypothetical protein